MTQLYQNPPSARSPHAKPWGSALMALALGLGAGSAPGAVTLNPSGGTNASDGLMIGIEQGAYQIQRNNLTQIYDPDESPASLQVMLAAEGGSNGCTYEDRYLNGRWTPISGPTLSGSAPTWSADETLKCTINGRDYLVQIITTYTTANPYADVHYVVTVPAGSPGPVRLYLAADFYLDGSDDGPGVTMLFLGRRLVAQAQYTGSDVTAVGGVLEAPTEAGVLTDFTSWWEAYYRCPFGYDDYYNTGDCGPNPPYGPTSADGLYPNTVDPDPDTDAGVGAHWDLIASAGTPLVAPQTFHVKTRLYFSNVLPNAPGVCGPAAGVATAFAPSGASNLCSAGTAGSVTAAASQWTWNCAGTGTPTACAAPYQQTNPGSGAGHASVSGGTWVVDPASPGFVATPTGAPAGYNFPHGLFSFTLTDGDPGTSAQVVITYPSTLPAGTVFWKYGPTASNPTDHWYVYPNAVISGNQVTLTLTDDADGDDDYDIPGQITDPGGPGVPANNTVTVPTLSEWGLLLLAGLLGMFGVRHMRRGGGFAS